jgi:hypothetical protein
VAIDCLVLLGVKTSSGQYELSIIHIFKICFRGLEYPASCAERAFDRETILARARSFLFGDVRPWTYITFIHKHNNTQLVRIQVTQQKENANVCTAANYHRRNYQAHKSFAVAREEEEHHQSVHSLALKKTSSQEALTSRDSHQPRKTGSSPIRNIGRRSPLSLFNAGPGPTPPRPLGSQILHRLPQIRNRQDHHTPRVTTSLSPLHDATPNQSHSNSLDSTKPLADVSNTSGEHVNGLGDDYSWKHHRYLPRHDANRETSNLENLGRKHTRTRNKPLLPLTMRGRQLERTGSKGSPMNLGAVGRGVLRR